MTDKMRSFVILMVAVFVFMLVLTGNEHEAGAMSGDSTVQTIKLPEPKEKGDVSVEEAILKRRSKRAFKNQTLTKEQVSQILWAAQGITDPDGKKRAAPSAMAIYPLEIYAVCPEATYHYIPQGHAIEKIADGDLRGSLSEQKSVSGAAMDIVITAVFERFPARIDEKSIAKFVYIEAGHCAQNIHLQTVALGLGSVSVGGYSEEKVSRALSLPANRKPIYIIPVGYPQ